MSKKPKLEIGDRVRCNAGKLGTVRYVGEVHYNSGVWVGVELDEPKKGMGDGVFKGKRYFKCKRKHAFLTKIMLVRPLNRSSKRPKSRVSPSAKSSSSTKSPSHEPQKPKVSTKEVGVQTEEEKEGPVLSQQLHQIAGEKMVKLTRQVKELTEKVISQETEINQLKDELDYANHDLEMHVISAQTNIQQLELAREEIEELQIRLEAAQLDIEILQAEEEEVRDKVYDSLEIDEAEKAQLVESNMHMTKVLESVKKQIAEELKIRDRRIADLDAELLTMPKLKSRLEELNAVKLELRDKKKEIKQLQIQVDDALENEEFADRITFDNNKKEIRIEELGKEIMHLNECKSLAEAESMETYEYISELEMEINEKVRDIQERDEQLEEKKAEILDLQKTVYQFRQAVRKLQVESNQLEFGLQMNQQGQIETKSAMNKLRYENINLRAELESRRCDFVGQRTGLLLTQQAEMERDIYNAHIPKGVMEIDTNTIEALMLSERLIHRARICRDCIASFYGDASGMAHKDTTVVDFGLTLCSMLAKQECFGWVINIGLATATPEAFERAKGAWRLLDRVELIYGDLVNVVTAGNLKNFSTTALKETDEKLVKFVGEHFPQFDPEIVHKPSSFAKRHNILRSVGETTYRFLKFSHMLVSVEEKINRLTEKGAQNPDELKETEETFVIEEVFETSVLNWYQFQEEISDDWVDWDLPMMKTIDALKPSQIENWSNNEGMFELSKVTECVRNLDTGKTNPIRRCDVIWKQKDVMLGISQTLPENVAKLIEEAWRAKTSSIQYTTEEGDSYTVDIVGMQQKSATGEIFPLERHIIPGAMLPKRLERMAREQEKELEFAILEQIHSLEKTVLEKAKQASADAIPQSINYGNRDITIAAIERRFVTQLQWSVLHQADLAIRECLDRTKNLDTALGEIVEGHALTTKVSKINDLIRQESRERPDGLVSNLEKLMMYLSKIVDTLKEGGPSFTKTEEGATNRQPAWIAKQNVVRQQLSEASQVKKQLEEARKEIKQKVEDKFRTTKQHMEKEKENLVLHQELEKQKKRTNEIAVLQTENKKLQEQNSKNKDLRQKYSVQCKQYLDKIDELEVKISKLKEGGRTMEYGNNFGNNFVRDTKVSVGRSYGMSSDSSGRRGSESHVSDGSAGPTQLTEMLEYRELLEKTVASLKRQLLEIQNSKNTVALEKQIPAIPPFRRKFTKVESQPKKKEIEHGNKEEKVEETKRNLSKDVDALSRRLAAALASPTVPDITKPSSEKRNRYFTRNGMEVYKIKSDMARLRERIFTHTKSSGKKLMDTAASPSQAIKAVGTIKIPGLMIPKYQQKILMSSSDLNVLHQMFVSG